MKITNNKTKLNKQTNKISKFIDEIETEEETVSKYKEKDTTTSESNIFDELNNINFLEEEEFDESEKKEFITKKTDLNNVGDKEIILNYEDLMNSGYENDGIIIENDYEDIELNESERKSEREDISEWELKKINAALFSNKSCQKIEKDQTPYNYSLVNKEFDFLMKEKTLNSIKVDIDYKLEFIKNEINDNIRTFELSLKEEEEDLKAILNYFFYEEFYTLKEDYINQLNDACINVEKDTSEYLEVENKLFFHV